MRIYKTVAIISLALFIFASRSESSSPRPDQSADEKAILDVEARWQCAIDDVGRMP